MEYSSIAKFDIQKLLFETSIIAHLKQSNLMIHLTRGIFPTYITILDIAMELTFDPSPLNGVFYSLVPGLYF